MKLNFKLHFTALVITIFLTNIADLCIVGHKLDNLRDRVLRIHILANSDSIEDQQLKLYVRDMLLEHSEEIFGRYDSLEEAVENAEKGLEKAELIAEKAVAEKGFDYDVSAEVDNIYFDERTYGDITMPEGIYKALRVKIGKAEGHNWWCVMYPPLCIPAAENVTDSKKTENEFFTEDEVVIMKKPEKFKVKFMIWDKLKGIFG